MSRHVVIAVGESVDKGIGKPLDLAQATLHFMPDGVISVDANGRVEYMNPVAEALTGCTRDQAYGEQLQLMFGRFDRSTRQRAEDAVSVALVEGRIGSSVSEQIAVGDDGREYALEMSAAPIRGLSGEVVGVVLVFRDLTERWGLVSELHYQATHDALTGLLNRREFERYLHQKLALARTGEAEYALCYMDLDFFKVINDSCGHAAGDDLLKQLCVVLQRTIRKGDILGRLGGDEFGILLEECGREDAVHIAEKFQRTVRQFRFQWQGNPFVIGASIGIVPITVASGSIDDVLRAADAACYAAKNSGRDRIHVHEFY